MDGWDYVKIGLAFVVGLMVVAGILILGAKVFIPVADQVGQSFGTINDSNLQTQADTLVGAAGDAANTTKTIVKVVFGGLAILMVLIAIGVYAYKEFLKGKILANSLR